ncbi:hypothetical protein C8A05DRAFT_43618 [Staphylotrichum tortipilum]|uniref:Uncharacterized protein n=1 Tax=Staphylotrichum tortipilum TaxID=2831512 RepID=A0AAN6MNH7_9PEZI|nr:hypothetical protein C8A05DRAFT_43618 [Staphylotrichum longicolle]
MSRTAVHRAALLALVVATALTLTTLLTPSWISYTTHAPSGAILSSSLGLYRRCTTTTTPSSTSLTWTCTPFPDPARCGSDGEGMSFCAMWRAAGGLMGLAVVGEVVAVVGGVVGLGRARGRKEGRGWWWLVGGLAGVVGGLQVLAGAVVAYLYDHDDMFLVPGYRLDSSWYLCAASAAVALLAVVGLALAGLVLPTTRDGYRYQLLREPSGV